MVSKKMRKPVIPLYIRFLLSVYLTGMGFFTLFRVLLFLCNLGRLSNLPFSRFNLIFQAFLNGLRFDTVVSGYILAVPFLVLSASALLPERHQLRLFRSMVFYTVFFYSLAFFVCSVDIPYFTHFFSRVSTGIFAWAGSPGFVFKMIIEEVGYWIFIIPFAVISLLFWILIFRFWKKIQKKKSAQTGVSGFTGPVNGLAFFVVFAILLFVGIRGRLAVKSPIRVGTAYFSNFGFPNQLGLNPVFTLTRSLLDDLEQDKQSMLLMDEKRALRLVRQQFRVRGRAISGSPVARQVLPGGPVLDVNVVLVIMESMGAENMARYGNRKNLTPNLDRISREGVAFDRVYTSGTHTHSGIYSTLFGFPVWMRQNPLKPVSVLTYAGLPNLLRERDYSTVFFTTHDDQFDNMGGFLRANGFQRIVSQKDYPAERVLSTLGVADDFMFEFSIPVLNRLQEREGRFFAAFLTTSNHPPFIIPEHCGFESHTRDMNDRIVEYADWSLGKFLRLARQQKWFDRTLFVFIADSGINSESIYDLPLSFFHTPFILYAPSLLKNPLSVGAIGGQIDVFPTVMGRLNIPYVNNSLGIDLLAENRPYIYFCSDDKIGCLNHEFFLVIRDSGFQSLYHYPNRDPRDYSRMNQAIGIHMRSYCLSMLQTARWMVKNRKVGKMEASESGRKSKNKK
jgi:phosphoglycerol transferase MdoB-like AlkP superfamily enzyme